MARSIRAVTARVALTAGVAAVALVAYTAQAASAAVTVNQATITTGGGVPLNGTNPSTQLFTTTLPAQASCNGNGTTAGGSYEVDSFMEPDPFNFATTPLTFSGGAPTSGLELFAGGNPVAGIPPAPSNQIVGLPLTMEFGGTLLSTDVVPSGTSFTWDLGIACDHPVAGVTGLEADTVWSVPCTFTKTQLDANGYTWTCANPTGANTPEAPLAVGLPLGGAAVLGAVVYRQRRRSIRRNNAAAAA